VRGELVALERRAVLNEGRFFAVAAVEELEDAFGQPLARELAQVGDVVGSQLIIQYSNVTVNNVAPPGNVIAPCLPPAGA